MGQKVKGYRRNAVYGKNTRRQVGRQGGMEIVNPPQKYGWVKSGGGRTEKGYGKGEGRGNQRRRRLEEIFKSEGYETNGRVRKGDEKSGYTVYGEYLYAVDGKTAPAHDRGSQSAAQDIVYGKASNKTGRMSEQLSRQGRLAVERTERLCVSPMIARTRTGIEPLVAKDREVSQPSATTRLRGKRKRRVRRYETEVGRKITRQRVDREETRKERRRGREIEILMRMRKKSERSYREKMTKVVKSEEKSYSKRSKARRKGRNEEEMERIGDERRIQKKPRKGKVRTLARAGVVVLGGVLKMENRRVKRRVRKREGAGRGHITVRREMDGRRKLHAMKSRYGRKRIGYVSQVQRRKREAKPSGQTKDHSGDLESRSGVLVKAKRLVKFRARGRENGEKLTQVVTRRIRAASQNSRSKESSSIEGGYYGYRVTVTGTLNGGRRTTKMILGRGPMPYSTKRARIGSAEGVAKTSVGTLGVRVEYCYGLG